MTPTAQEMEALFGPDWRHPYCLWPRGSARPAPVAEWQPVQREVPSDLGQQIKLALEEAAA